MANSGNSQPRMLPIKLIFIVFRISSSKLYSLRNAIPSLVCARRLELWEREVLFLPRQPTGPTSERKEKQQTVASTSTPRRRRKEGKGKSSEGDCARWRWWKGRRMNLSYGFYHNGRNKHFHFQLGSASHRPNSDSFLAALLCHPPQTSCRLHRTQPRIVGERVESREKVFY